MTGGYSITFIRRLLKSYSSTNTSAPFNVLFPMFFTIPIILVNGYVKDNEGLI